MPTYKEMIMLALRALCAPRARKGCGIVRIHAYIRETYKVGEVGFNTRIRKAMAALIEEKKVKKPTVASYRPAVWAVKKPKAKRKKRVALKKKAKAKRSTKKRTAAKKKTTRTRRKKAVSRARKSTASRRTKKPKRRVRRRRRKVTSSSSSGSD